MAKKPNAPIPAVINQAIQEGAVVAPEPARIIGKLSTCPMVSQPPPPAAPEVPEDHASAAKTITKMGNGTVIYDF